MPTPLDITEEQLTKATSIANDTVQVLEADATVSGVTVISKLNGLDTASAETTAGLKTLIKALGVGVSRNQPAAGTTGGVFNVLDLGAKGDGTTDDTVAIQTAIDSAAAIGGTVLIPPSSAPYRHTGLTVYSGISIVGAAMTNPGGVGSELKLLADSNHAIYGADIRNFVIRDLNISGVAGTVLGSWDGIFLDQTGSTAIANISLENVFVSGFSRHGIHVEDGITSNLSNVRVQTCGGRGFYLDMGTSYTLHSCYANSCKAGGYYINDVHYSVIEACACDSSADGYYFNICSSLTSIGCGVEAGLAGSKGFVMSGGFGNAIINGRALNCPTIAFHVTGNSSRAILQGCRENSPGVGVTASIQVDSGSTALVMFPVTTTAVSYAANTTLAIDSGNLIVPSATTGTFGMSRASTANFVNINLSTAGVDQWAFQLRNDSTNDFHIRNVARGLTAFLGEERATAPNISLLTSAKNYGSGVGVIHIPNASTVPTTNPASGAILYTEGGIIKQRTPDGSVYSMMSSSGWQTALNIDFTVEASQDMTADGTYIIGGVTWTRSGAAANPTASAWTPNTLYGSGQVINSVGGIPAMYVMITAGTSASSGSGPSGTGQSIADGTCVWKFAGYPGARLVNGSGLYLFSNLTASLLARTCTLIKADLATVAPSLSTMHPVRIWIQFQSVYSPMAGPNAKGSVGLTSKTGNMNSYQGGKTGNPDVVATDIIANNSGSHINIKGGLSSTPSIDGSVVVLSLPTGLQGGQCAALAGTYSTGWPSESSLKVMAIKSVSPTAFTTDSWDLFLSSDNQAASTYATANCFLFKRIKLEYKL